MLLKLGPEAPVGQACKEMAQSPRGHAKSSMISDLLYNHVLDVQKFEQTGCLVSCNSLRPKRARQAFSFVERSPRFFTRSAVEGAVKILMHRYNLEVPLLARDHGRRLGSNSEQELALPPQASCQKLVES